MEKKTKNILLVVGGVAILYLIYKRFNGFMQGKGQEIEPDVTDNSYVDGVVDRPFPIVKYKFIQPHSVEYTYTPTRTSDLLMNVKKYEVGDVIETKRKSGGTLVTYTTLDGKAPNFDVVGGEVWLEIPLEKLEEVTTTNFTGVDNFFKGHSQNCSGLNCI